MTALEDRIRRVAAAPKLLVALDFDGTLSPLVSDPMSARATPAAKQIVDRLAALPGVTVALVSGRSLCDLRIIAEHGDDSPVWLVGSHGSEQWIPEGSVARTAAPSARGEETAPERAAEILAEAHRLAESHSGAWIEDKAFGFALHTRTCEMAVEREAQVAIDALMTRDAPQWRRREGKRVLEFSWRAEGKDTAVARLREELHADAVIFAGDDVTDEDALRALGEGDLGVRVGPGETAGHARVDDTQGLVDVLSRVAELRAS